MLDPTGGARARSEPVPAHSTPRLTTEEARLAEQDAHHRRERQQFEEKLRSMEADMTRQHKAMTLQQERHDEETETLRSLLDDHMLDNNSPQGTPGEYDQDGLMSEEYARLRQMQSAQQTRDDASALRDDIERCMLSRMHGDEGWRPTQQRRERISSELTRERTHDDARKQAEAMATARARTHAHDARTAPDGEHATDRERTHAHGRALEAYHNPYANRTHAADDDAYTQHARQRALEAYRNPYANRTHAEDDNAYTQHARQRPQGRTDVHDAQKFIDAQKLERAIFGDLELAALPPKAILREVMLSHNADFRRRLLYVDYPRWVTEALFATDAAWMTDQATAQHLDEAGENDNFVRLAIAQIAIKLRARPETCPSHGALAKVARHDEPTLTLKHIQRALASEGDSSSGLLRQQQVRALIHGGIKDTDPGTYVCKVIEQVKIYSRLGGILSPYEVLCAYIEYYPDKAGMAHAKMQINVPQTQTMAETLEVIGQLEKSIVSRTTLAEGLARSKLMGRTLPTTAITMLATGAANTHADTHDATRTYAQGTHTQGAHTQGAYGATRAHVGTHDATQTHAHTHTDATRDARTYADTARARTDALGDGRGASGGGGGRGAGAGRGGRGRGHGGRNDERTSSNNLDGRRTPNRPGTFCITCGQNHHWKQCPQLPPRIAQLISQGTYFVEDAWRDGHTQHMSPKLHQHLLESTAESYHPKAIKTTKIAGLANEISRNAPSSTWRPSPRDNGDVHGAASSTDHQDTQSAAAYHIKTKTDAAADQHEHDTYMSLFGGAAGVAMTAKIGGHGDDQKGQGALIDSGASISVVADFNEHTVRNITHQAIEIEGVNGLGYATRSAELRLVFGGMIIWVAVVEMPRIPITLISLNQLLDAIPQGTVYFEGAWLSINTGKMRADFCRCDDGLIRLEISPDGTISQRAHTQETTHERERHEQHHENKTQPGAWCVPCQQDAEKSTHDETLFDSTHARTTTQTHAHGDANARTLNAYALITELTSTHDARTTHDASPTHDGCHTHGARTMTAELPGGCACGRQHGDNDAKTHAVYAARAVYRCYKCKQCKRWMASNTKDVCTDEGRYCQ